MKLDRLTNELFGLSARLADCDTPGQIRHVRSHALARFFENDQVFRAFAILSSNLASGYVARNRYGVLGARPRRAKENDDRDKGGAEAHSGTD